MRYVINKKVTNIPHRKEGKDVKIVLLKVETEVMVDTTNNRVHIVDVDGKFVSTTVNMNTMTLEKESPKYKVDIEDNEVVVSDRETGKLVLWLVR